MTRTTVSARLAQLPGDRLELRPPLGATPPAPSRSSTSTTVPAHRANLGDSVIVRGRPAVVVEVIHVPAHHPRRADMGCPIVAHLDARGVVTERGTRWHGVTTWDREARLYRDGAHPHGHFLPMDEVEPIAA